MERADPITYDPKHVTKRNYWGVARGKVAGVYTSWTEAKEQVSQYPRASWKKFRTFEEADAFVNPWKYKVAAPGTEQEERSAGNDTIMWVEEVQKREKERRRRGVAIPEPVNKELTEQEKADMLPNNHDDPVHHMLHVWMATEYSRRGSWALYFGKDHSLNSFQWFPSRTLMPHRVRLAATSHALSKALQWCRQNDYETQHSCLYLHTEDRYTFKLVNGWVTKSIRAPWYANLRPMDVELYYTVYEQLKGTRIRVVCCKEPSVSVEGMREAYLMLAEHVPRNFSGAPGMELLGWNTKKRQLLNGSEDHLHAKSKSMDDVLGKEEEEDGAPDGEEETFEVACTSASAPAPATPPLSPPTPPLLLPTSTLLYRNTLEGIYEEEEAEDVEEV